MEEPTNVEVIYVIFKCENGLPLCAYKLESVARSVAASWNRASDSSVFESAQPVYAVMPMQLFRC